MRASRRLLAVAVTLGLSGAASGGVVSPDLDRRLRASAADDLIPVVVRLVHQGAGELPDVVPGATRSERRQWVSQRLHAAHDTDQGRLVQRATGARAVGHAANVTRLWLVNALTLDASPHLIRDLADDPDVAEVTLSGTVVITPTTDGTDEDPTLPAVNGVERIRAPLVWDLGATGQGAVVGIIDTGVKYNHPDLAGKWRGGSNSWHDEVGARLRPDDQNGHGTHVTGTMVGGNVVGPNYIGVAWGAQFIACRAFDRNGVGSDTTLLHCLDWMADPDGDPHTDDLPDAVNGSWSYDAPFIPPPGVCYPAYDLAVKALRALDVVPVFAAGNFTHSGSPANYSSSLSVGAVDRSNQLAGFSGLGPSACTGDPIYPDLTAPGTKVRSAWPGGVRKNLAGTSMAAPHVTGTVALLRGHRPSLTVAEIEHILEATAVDLGAPGPDSGYGYGMLDAFRAFGCLDHGTYSGCAARCP